MATEKAALPALLDGDDLRLLRVEATMFKARWFAAVFALVQTFTFYKPYPPGYERFALLTIAVLAIGNLILRRVFVSPHLNSSRLKQASMISILMDFIVVQGLILTFTFDPETAIWALVYILPLMGAIRFQLRGALIITALATVAYIGREFYGSRTFGYDFLWSSISFRMGIAFVIAYTAGNMSSTLTHESRAVASSNRDLAKLNESMRDFVAIASHEMRTPLTVMNGMSTMLADQWDTFDDKQRREMIEVIRRQGKNLISLVNDLLTASQVDSGVVAVKLQTIDANEVVRFSLENLVLTNDVTVDVREGLQLQADPNHLQRIIVNLVMNAEKYGRGPVEVQMGIERGDVVLIVRDSGDGVPDKFVPRLFSKFSRAANKSGSFREGAGLGLSIVSGLAEANDGEVSYKRSETGGAEFSVRFRSTGSQL